MWLHCYQLKTDWYSHKIFCVSPMVTTKNRPKRDTQKKMRKKIKACHYKKKKWNTKKDSKRGKEI